MAFGDPVRAGEHGCNVREDGPTNDFSRRVLGHRVVAGRESGRVYLERSGLWQVERIPPGKTILSVGF